MGTRARMRAGAAIGSPRAGRAPMPLGGTVPAPRTPPPHLLSVLALAALLVGGLAGCAESNRTQLPDVGVRPPGWIDVRVARGGAPRVGCAGPCRVLGDDGAERLLAERVDWQTPLELADEGLLLGGFNLGEPPVELRPQGSALLAVEGVRYRGLLRVEVDGEGELRVLNRLPLEDYLKGVLPGEMPDRFGSEALKAQAVAARSYALAESAGRPWLFPDVRSQVYGGRDVETWLASRAVEATAGQVLVRDADVVPAWFQSTCGGGTARADQVFDDPPEGVMDRHVPCGDCRGSPTWAWERRIAGDLVCRAAGLPDVPLERIEAEPGLFPGRPEWITVHAGGLESRVRAVDLRDRVSKGRPWNERLLSTRWQKPPRVVDGDLVVDGHGWGHGVGLCQYGARGYARRGAGYRVILRRYYPGAELVQLR